MLEATQERARERAQYQVERAKDELGRQLFLVLEDHFPEQTKARRQQDSLQMFVVGVAVGILLRHLLNQ
ncbi:hypothetical protein [Haladaptatus halobius]|uniref:hypothetical protein n=1 Tax=Haladaptatus halobius TaxID=2884875 RepID=UPI001D0B73F3|nr:hypothetical protein [Haladaptatus halobius]